MKRLFGLLGSLALIAAIAVAQAPAHADVISALCTNTTYVDGTNSQTKKRNFGSATDLVIRGTSKFAFLECVVTGVPVGATGVGATLNLYSRTANGDHTVRLHNQPSAWTESTVNWNTLHSFDAAVLSSANGNAVPGAGEIVDLPASTVTGNGTFRFAIDTTTALDELYASDDYTADITRRPKLTVTYTPATTTTTTTTIPPGEDAAGDVDFYLWAKSAADYFTSDPTQAQRDFMVANYHRALVFGPSASVLSGDGYWNTRLAWYSTVHEYLDAYAIKPAEITNYPELDSYILRDAAGNRVYIDFGCSPTCPQYAGDVGNPGFRTWFLGQIQRDVDRGYPGIFADDVNMDFRFSDVNGNSLTPIDPRTGAPMTQANYRAYFRDFLDLVRTTYPALELVHNTIWYADQDSVPPFSDPDVAAELADSDWIMIEHGFNDAGLDASGTFSVRYLLDYLDRIHSLGSNFIMNDELADTPAQWENNLAGYLLASNGGDMVGSEDYGTMAVPGSIYPDEAHFWDGFQLNLGDALGARADWVVAGQTFIRRDFTGGFVVHREPTLAAASFDVPAGYHRIDGTPVTGPITLSGRNSAVLIAD
jgi:hypothetical protein